MKVERWINSVRDDLSVLVAESNEQGHFDDALKLQMLLIQVADLNLEDEERHFASLFDFPLFDPTQRHFQEPVSDGSFVPAVASRLADIESPDPETGGQFTGPLDTSAVVKAFEQQAKDLRAQMDRMGPRANDYRE